MAKRVTDDFGMRPDVEYFHGDMDYIRSYFDHERFAHPNAFSLDDITWNDLDMDRVFRRVNRGRTLSGEQALYHLLRTPATDAAEWTRRRDLIHLTEDESRRKRVSPILSKLGCVRRAGPCTPDEHIARRSYLALYIALALLLPLAIASFAFLGQNAILVIFCVIIVNSMMHEIMKRHLAGDLDAVNYMVSLARAVKRLKKLNDKALDAHLAPAYDALSRMKTVLRVGFAVPADAGGNPSDLLLTLTLFDLIAYERLKRVFFRQHDDVLALHDALGRLDAAISIASWRQTLPVWCEPEIVFSPNALRGLSIEGMVHPLLEHPVANDVSAARSLLVTGSNASGKSTYLKAATLCAVLAQSACTCPAKAYSAPAFLIFTSMTLKDDLLAGESYYIAEMRAIKRILDHLNGPLPVLCAVDEVLRGTNTVERIAASCEILTALDRTGALCVAATHDAELCDLLGNQYENLHFEERIEDGRMLFDYRVRPGKTTTRNAINLLGLIGLDESIVDGAHARAQRYEETGLWS